MAWRDCGGSHGYWCAVCVKAGGGAASVHRFDLSGGL